MIAPFVACMRSATAMLHEASTTNRIRLAARLTRTFFCRSVISMEKATLRSSRCSVRAIWLGAAARSVASKATSLVWPWAGLAWM